jgi:gamma-glutamyltranspeptidase/glutathione hydrolase
MTTQRPLFGRVIASLALAASMLALGIPVSGARAAAGDPYSMQAQALLSPSGTDLTLRVDGPVRPEVLEKVQVKAWASGAEEADTQNFFDVASPDGVATLRLTGLERGERLEIRVHVKDGPQHNLEAETTVLRRPDLTVTGIDVPADVVRTRAFDVTATVAEVGGDVGADARVTLFDGPVALAEVAVTVAAGSTSAATFRVSLTRPREHTLGVAITNAAPAEWDVAPNAVTRELYVHHYDANGVVATDHPLATQVGVDVLKNGGNAFDAAAAVQFALNVTQPHLAGIGGGSNILVRLESGETLAIDAREQAPAATTATTYSGKTPLAVGPNGYAVGVPGTLRAVDYLLDRWGTMSLAATLEPAIELAENGFPVGSNLALFSADARAALQPETRALFRRPSGAKLEQGDLLVQPELAKTFRLIAREGASALYRGEIAEAIVAAQRRATAAGGEGRMTHADLAAYDIEVESAISIGYHGYDVLGPRPSTNGGVVVLEALGLIREFRASNPDYAWGFGSRNSLHVFLEAMRLALADRDMWLGDERFSPVPTDALLNAEYLADRSKLIGGETVIPGVPAPGNPSAYLVSAAAVEEGEREVGHTTHFSIIDRWGNAVVMTSTVADAFGSGITVPGYGFLLNDSLTLFNLTPRANPATGNPGANDAGPGKRPMGSMAPTLILKDGEPFAATGTYGGGFIPSVVLNVVLNLIEYGMPLQEAVDAPRLWTAVARGDAAVNLGLASAIEPLRAMGHVAPPLGLAGNVARAPGPATALGSTGSFGVDLGTFGLLGGEDSTRFPDAKTAIVERT